MIREYLFFVLQKNLDAKKKTQKDISDNSEAHVYINVGAEIKKFILGDVTKSTKINKLIYLIQKN